MKGGEDSFNFTNLVVDFEVNIPPEVLDEGGPGLQFMLNIGDYFLSDDKPAKLLPHYKKRWNAVVPRFQKLMTEGKLHGFNLGDQVLMGTQCSIDTLRIMAETVKASFPDAPTWTNFDRGTLEDGLHLPLPKAIDWLSVDHYRNTEECKMSSDDLVSQVEGYYKKYFYPHMESHQKLAIVPGVKYDDNDGGDRCGFLGPRIDCDFYTKKESQDLDAYLKWAEREPRIVAFMPYVYKTFGSEHGLKELRTMCDGGKELYNKFVDIGTQVKTRMSAARSADTVSV
jgi:hypothetical protein